jgi:predicted regulator of Ras-like GTPase activity (Roadblock/LC7/MglB family)
MPSRTDEMVARLRNLQATTPDIEAAAVVSVDGLIMASALPRDVEEDRVSAMSAAMLSLGERIAIELGRGQLDQVFIRGERGYVVLMSIGAEAVLTALTRREARLGVIFLDMRRTAAELSRLI